MKELSIKEKAKAYDSIFERLKEMYNNNKTNIVARLIYERYFPELKESEDEKIKKRIIALINAHGQGMYKEDMLAWLEKKGEQKPQGKSALEAIKEEKVDNANKVEPRQEKLTKFEKAVKQVMEEAIECGDTRSLKADADMLLSLIHKPAWSEDDELHIRELESLVKQVWTTAEHENDKDTIHKMSDLSFFLKTLKPQPKQEWSEEDDIMKQHCHQMLALLRPNSSELIKDIIDNCHHWLKSLKNRVQPQNTWKPSEEHPSALHYVTNFDYGGHKATLVSLYEQLKKLKGQSYESIWM